MSFTSEKDTPFCPVLSFMAASDAHIEYEGDKSCQRIKKALELSYKVTNGRLHAVLFCGDIANSGTPEQFTAFKKLTDCGLHGGTRLLALTAKYHDGGEMGKKALEYFRELTGISGNMHTVINGFHFITVSTSTEENVYYSEYQRIWLKKQLDEAVKDDPAKPVFVSHHEHVKYTVYGSFDEDGWGNDYFRDILNDYPQVFHLSGHSHYPVNDPRSIWQGEFTAIGTGALKYLEFTVDGERKIHPEGYGDEAECWLIECDEKNALRLRAYDVIEGRLLCEYRMDSPFSREYTPEKMRAGSKPPVFTEREVTTEKAEGELRVAFRRAESTDGMPVFLYRVYITGENGEIIKETKCLADYYSATGREKITVSFPVSPEIFEKGKGIRIKAETAYGVSAVISEPLVYSAYL